MNTDKPVHTVLGHNIDDIWDESDAPDTARGRDRLFNMTKFIEDFSMFNRLCNKRGWSTSDSMALYKCFIMNELREVLE